MRNMTPKQRVCTYKHAQKMHLSSKEGENIFKKPPHQINIHTCIILMCKSALTTIWTSYQLYLMESPQTMH